MAAKKAKEQTKKSVEQAKNKGSQRVYTVAMVDSDSFVEFYIPEWVVALSGKDGGEFKNPTWVPDSANPWQPKKSTKEGDSKDEQLTSPGAGGGARNVRQQALLGTNDESSGTSFVGRKVKLYLADGVDMKRGNKPYRHKSFRVPAALNTLAILYFIQQAIGKDKVTHFSTGKTKYPVDVKDVTLANLGQLRDDDGATTSKGTEYTAK